MCEELSYQIINTTAVNQAVICLLEVCKNHYKKENISAHRIYIFTLCFDILSFFAKELECKILVQIHD